MSSLKESVRSIAYLASHRADSFSTRLKWLGGKTTENYNEWRRLSGSFYLWHKIADYLKRVQATPEKCLWVPMSRAIIMENKPYLFRNDRYDKRANLLYGELRNVLFGHMLPCSMEDGTVEILMRVESHEFSTLLEMEKEDAVKADTAIPDLGPKIKYSFEHKGWEQK